MYAQLTTGKPLHIISRVRGEKLATEMFVSIDTAKNRPELQMKPAPPWGRGGGVLSSCGLKTVPCVVLVVA
jgi:DNA topoisomerase VI subunit B